MNISLTMLKMPAKFWKNYWRNAEQVKENYQRKLAWEERQDEIENNSPNFNTVLKDLGCKQPEIDSNLKIAMQIKYDTKKLEVSIEENGKLKKATVDHNIECITLIDSDDKAPLAEKDQVEMEIAKPADLAIESLNTSVQKCNI